MNEILKSKDEVMRAFANLLEERKRLRAKILTKEENAQQEKNKEIVATASQYTTAAIVKGLADLQLELGKSVNELSQKLQSELSKLDEIKAAIEFETQHLKDINDTQIAADALFMLRQEQEANNKAFDEEVAAKLQTLEDEIAKIREEWEKEQKEHDLMVEERTESLKKDREKELADYIYELDRTYKIEADAFAERRKLLERELLETEATKIKDWAMRDKILEINKPKFDEYKAKVDGGDEEIKEAVKKAREEAIKTTSRETKIKADLFEKEMEGSKQVFELQIQSLEGTIEKQTTQVEKLQNELKEALLQIQNLSFKAIENANTAKKND